MPGPGPLYRAAMREIFGDSSRGGDWAAVRLRVDGDRIVEADAPGLERDVAGLTLLEAAAVGGETLAVDALANALGPVFRAEPSPGRVAVAMSGGVDSAVALLRSLPERGRRDACGSGSIPTGPTPSAPAARPRA